MKQYTSYRQIKFGGRWSLDDFGALIGQEIDSDTRIERAKPRILRETIPFMDGSYDYSRIGGKLVYDDRYLRYTFILSGHTRADVEGKASRLDDWLGAVTDTELYDTDFQGWKFTGVAYLGMSELSFYSANETKARVTVEFTASPYMRSLSGKLIDCTTFTPSTNSDRYLFDVYAPSAVPTCYLVRTTTAVGGTFIVAEDIEITTYYADVSVTGDSSQYWLAMPKEYGGNVFRVTELENCNAIENPDYWVVRAKAATVSFRVSGSAQGDGCRTAVLNATWIKSGSKKSWDRRTIPSTSNMRIVSEGTPTLSINGTAADIAGFPLAAGDLLTVGNSKSEPCRLQFCTVKERR